MNGKTYLPPIVVAMVMLPHFAAAEDVRGISPPNPELKVIDEKCLVCHNRQRIDDAARERKNMESVLSLMEKKGVSLTENDRRVIGHFWRQKLFREKKGEK